MNAIITLLVFGYILAGLLVASAFSKEADGEYQDWSIDRAGTIFTYVTVIAACWKFLFIDQ